MEHTLKPPVRQMPGATKIRLPVGRHGDGENAPAVPMSAMRSKMQCIMFVDMFPSACVELGVGGKCGCDDMMLVDH